jgi:hypothetical protein
VISTVIRHGRRTDDRDSVGSGGDRLAYRHRHGGTVLTSSHSTIAQTVRPPAFRVGTSDRWRYIRLATMS